MAEKNLVLEDLYTDGGGFDAERSVGFASSALFAPSTRLQCLGAVDIQPIG